ncbi:hypothetical protein B6A10_05930 [Flavobacterium sp. L1I52]|uniref:FAS1 domain-containing protein n=1 Tax=Flavobacterium pokkalii TaxID=1940408 RepID=A0ABR7UP93_9FLAO|nr:fasciclin domain-containing protein [Flavobacterium pokkalii]MBD0724712.1 hypothetical protein [Flavobacterium pokkalii]
MKIRKHITNLFTGILASVIVLSCNIPDDNINVIHFVPGEVKNPVTITQVIIKDPNLSIFEKLMRRIENSSNSASGKILSQLNLPGNTTVFAPTDTAFDAFMQANGITNIDNLPLATIQSIVYNHLISGKILAADFTTGFVSSQATRVSGSNTVNLSMYINTTDGVVLNGNSKVITPNVELENGVIHYVDKVVDLPTIDKLLSFDSNFSTLRTAITYSDSQSASPVIFDAINNTNTSVTLFAPTNTAFSNVLTELSKASLQDLTPTQVGNILKIHTISTATTTAAISSSLFVSRTNTKLQTLLTGTVGQINFNGTAKTIKDPRARTANITVKDLQAINGVIHSVDKVILPTTL